MRWIVPGVEAGLAVRGCVRGEDTEGGVEVRRGDVGVIHCRCCYCSSGGWCVILVQTLAVDIGDTYRITSLSNYYWLDLHGHCHCRTCCDDEQSTDQQQRKKTVTCARTRVSAARWFNGAVGLIWKRGFLQYILIGLQQTLMQANAISTAQRAQQMINMQHTNRACKQHQRRQPTQNTSYTNTNITTQSHSHTTYNHNTTHRHTQTHAVIGSLHLLL